MNEEIENRLKMQELAGSSISFNTLEENQCHKLCSSGTCQADCCGCVSMREAYFKRLKKLIPTGTEYKVFTYKENGETYVKPITLNHKCVFLTKQNACIIHDSHLRPELCKRFGEDKLEPLFACIHINQEVKDEIEGFQQAYLSMCKQEGNPLC